MQRGPVEEDYSSDSDFDLDGMQNAVQQLDVRPDPLGEQNPFENAFRARPTTLETEKQARAHLNLETARTWKIVNPAPVAQLVRFA